MRVGCIVRMEERVEDATEGEVESWQIFDFRFHHA